MPHTLSPCCQSCGLHWGWTQCSVFLTYIWHQFLFYSEVKPIDNTTKKHDLKKREREHVALTVIHRRGNRKETYNHSVRAFLLSPVRLFVTPQTAACQPPLSMKFFRQEYWSRLPFLTLGDLPWPRVEHSSPVTPAWVSRFFTTEPPGKPNSVYISMWTLRYDNIRSGKSPYKFPKCSLGGRIVTMGNHNARSFWPIDTLSCLLTH